MGFLKFVFVLLLVVPVAVLMLYFVSNLSDKMKISIKNQKNNDSLRTGKCRKAHLQRKKQSHAAVLHAGKRTEEKKALTCKNGLKKMVEKAARLSEESVSMTYTDPQEHRRAEIISRIRRITAKNRK